MRNQDKFIITYRFYLDFNPIGQDRNVMIEGNGELQRFVLILVLCKPKYNIEV